MRLIGDRERTQLQETGYCWVSGAPTLAELVEVAADLGIEPGRLCVLAARPGRVALVVN